MKCNYCEEQLENIAIDHGQPPVTLFPSKDLADLHVCTRSDCKNVGIVLCIPREAKD